MNTPPDFDEEFQLAYSLRHPQRWAIAMKQLHGKPHKAVLQGLIELLHNPPSANAAKMVIAALEDFSTSPVIEALEFALGSGYASVRLAAIRALQTRGDATTTPVMSRMLSRDSSWLVRRTAVEFLSLVPSEQKWDILKAATDPHWRVRHALIQVLLKWSDSESSRDEISSRLKHLGSDARVKGLIRYLEFRQTGNLPKEAIDEDVDPHSWCEFWDWDPAVLAFRLERMTQEQRRALLPILSRLIGHDDERVRRWAAKPILRDGGLPELLDTLRCLDDPRHPARETVAKLVGQLDWERREEMAQSVFALDAPSVGQWVWAWDQIEDSLDADDIPNFPELCHRAMQESPPVRAALARMLSRVETEEQFKNPLLQRLLTDSSPDVILAVLEGMIEIWETNETVMKLEFPAWEELLASEDSEIRRLAAALVFKTDQGSKVLSQLANDPVSLVRAEAAKWLVTQHDANALTILQADENPVVRAAAMTESLAKDLVQNPARETSWWVLEHAFRLAKTSLWNITPEAVSVRVQTDVSPPELLSIPQAKNPVRRALRPELEVSPLGISGHYGLPVEGFEQAMEQGVNFMFWEPNYHTLTQFMERLPKRERNEIQMTAGSFEASPERIRRDVIRALNKLQIEQLPVFLLFWTRSWDRITDEVRDMLEQLKVAGKIGCYGLSTHSRTLAVEAIEADWNPVMVRHSAAHRGAETDIFSHARKQGTGLLTFNNTCYGRLLQAISTADAKALSPADCYRYTLSFEAVTACWSAPATLEELHENLLALSDPHLPADRLQQLCVLGKQVYQEDTVFRKCVRGV